MNLFKFNIVEGVDTYIPLECSLNELTLSRDMLLNTSFSFSLDIPSTLTNDGILNDVIDGVTDSKFAIDLPTEDSQYIYFNISIYSFDSGVWSVNLEGEKTLLEKYSNYNFLDLITYKSKVKVPFVYSDYPACQRLLDFPATFTKDQDKIVSYVVSSGSMTSNLKSLFKVPYQLPGDTYISSAPLCAQTSLNNLIECSDVTKDILTPLIDNTDVRDYHLAVPHTDAMLYDKYHSGKTLVLQTRIGKDDEKVRGNLEDVQSTIRCIQTWGDDTTEVNDYKITEYKGDTFVVPETGWYDINFSVPVNFNIGVNYLTSDAGYAGLRRLYQYGTDDPFATDAGAELWKDSAFIELQLVKTDAASKLRTSFYDLPNTTVEGTVKEGTITRTALNSTTDSLGLGSDSWRQFNRLPSQSATNTYRIIDDAEDAVFAIRSGYPYRFWECPFAADYLGQFKSFPRGYLTQFIPPIEVISSATPGVESQFITDANQWFDNHKNDPLTVLYTGQPGKQIEDTYISTDIFLNLHPRYEDTYEVAAYEDHNDEDCTFSVSCTYDAVNRTVIKTFHGSFKVYLEKDSKYEFRVCSPAAVIADHVDENGIDYKWVNANIVLPPLSTSSQFISIFAENSSTGGKINGNLIPKYKSSITSDSAVDTAFLTSPLYTMRDRSISDVADVLTKVLQSPVDDPTSDVLNADIGIDYQIKFNTKKLISSNDYDRLEVDKDDESFKKVPIATPVGTWTSSEPPATYVGGVEYGSGSIQSLMDINATYFVAPSDQVEGTKFKFPTELSFFKPNLSTSGADYQYAIKGAEHHYVESGVVSAGDRYAKPEYETLDSLRESNALFGYRPREYHFKCVLHDTLLKKYLSFNDEYYRILSYDEYNPNTGYAEVTAVKTHEFRFDDDGCLYDSNSNPLYDSDDFRLDDNA